MISRISKSLIAFAIMAQCSAVMSAGQRISETEIVIGIHIYGEVPCKINNSQSYNINFGSMDIDEIDGRHFEKQMQSNIDCFGTVPNEIYMIIQASVAQFDEKIIATSTPNLGIKLKGNGKDIIPNEEILYNWRTPLVISAVPVKDAKNIPATGDFSATATIALYVH